MKPIIYPYNIGSKSARALARALRTICVRENGTFVPKPDHVIITWGNPRKPRWARPGSHFYLHGLNDPVVLPVAQDKLATFTEWKRLNIPTPEWTTDRKVAEKWVSEANVVLARTLLNSHSGKGIVLMMPNAKSVSAPLYVLYKKKKKEFRVHVFNGKVIDVQQKRLANGAKEEEGYNQYIRSHANGWIFARENVSEPKDLRSLAVNAVKALRLDFGAVDIIYNEKENKCFCLEVNSAPGLEGQTLVSYTNAIKEYVNASGKSSTEGRPLQSVDAAAPRGIRLRTQRRQPR